MIVSGVKYINLLTFYVQNVLNIRVNYLKVKMKTNVLAIDAKIVRRWLIFKTQNIV